MTETAKNIPCKNCGIPTDPLALFPGTICLECYRQTEDARRPISADELVAMWGGKRP